MIINKWKGINQKNILNISLKDYFKKDNILIFHHIHKTAGTSIEKILGDWYILIRDFNLKETYDLKDFTNACCKSGHYGYHNIHLTDLFPGILDDHRYKVFSFVRDPLQRAISHFHHWKKSDFKAFENLSIEDFLLAQSGVQFVDQISTNWMAYTLQVRHKNYKTVLDKYYFIGVFEKLQESCDILAGMLSKPKYSLPRIRSGSYNVPIIDSDIIKEFKDRNEMDYMIYEYACNRLLEEKLCY